MLSEAHLNLMSDLLDAAHGRAASDDRSWPDVRDDVLVAVALMSQGPDNFVRFTRALLRDWASESSTSNVVSLRPPTG